MVGPVLLLFIEHRFPEYQEALSSLHFFTFVFLSLIAFGIGDELNRKKLKSIGKGIPPSTILESSLSFHILCTKTLSMLIESSSTPNFLKSLYFSATAEISVAQTNVKSPG